MKTASRVFAVVIILAVVLVIIFIPGSPKQKEPIQDTDNTAGSPDPVLPEPSVVPTIVIITGDIVALGGYYWRVLDVHSGSALLLSEDIIEWHPFHDERTNVTWEDSSLRAYLNGDFYLSLSEADRIKIEDTEIKTNVNPWFGIYGGGVTHDKIFLLSVEEAVRYLGDSGQLKEGNPDSDFIIDDLYNTSRIAYNNITDSAAQKWAAAYWDGLFESYEDALEYIGKYDGSPGWWWLRSPGSSSDSAIGVVYSGELIMVGDYVDTAAAGGVRPAMWIDAYKISADEVNIYERRYSDAYRTPGDQ